MGSEGLAMDWRDSFEAFTVHHLVVVVVCAAVTWVVCRYRRAVRLEGGCGSGGVIKGEHGSANRATAFRCVIWEALRVDLAWAVMTSAGLLGSMAVWYLPHRYDRMHSWPLHLCDFAAWIAPLALLGPWRWPKTIFFFWGLGLSSQGFLTPVVKEGVGDAAYWVFWAQHLGVVGGAVYLGVGQGYRPRARDFGLAVAATLLLVAVMVWFNLRMGTNYMYVGDMLPGKKTVLDALGPWPGRVGWLCVIGTVAFGLVWGGSALVWWVSGKMGGPGRLGE